MIERAPDGTINNCALANSDEEKNCQVCQGACPDRSSSRLSEWLTKKAQEALDEHVRPEIQALAKRGNVTPAEVAELRCNSWEWEHLVPAMNDEALVGRVEHALANCGRHRRPFLTYNEAVEGLYAPELLRRFKLLERAARDYEEALDNIREALGQKRTHHLVMAGDVKDLVLAVQKCDSDYDCGCCAAVLLKGLQEEAP
jgi:hypothetical protein